MRRASGAATSFRLAGSMGLPWRNTNCGGWEAAQVSTGDQDGWMGPWGCPERVNNLYQGWKAGSHKGAGVGACAKQPATTPATYIDCWASCCLEEPPRVPSMVLGTSNNNNNNRQYIPVPVQQPIPYVRTYPRAISAAVGHHLPEQLLHLQLAALRDWFETQQVAQHQVIAMQISHTVAAHPSPACRAAWQAQAERAGVFAAAPNSKDIQQQGHPAA